MRHTGRLGIQKVMEQSFDLLIGQRQSFEIDAIDPTLAPATGTSIVGWLTYWEDMYPIYYWGNIQCRVAVSIGSCWSQSSAGHFGGRSPGWSWLAVDVIASILVRQGREGTMSVTDCLLPLHHMHQKMKNMRDFRTYCILTRVHHNGHSRVVRCPRGHIWHGHLGQYCLNKNTCIFSQL